MSLDRLPPEAARLARALGQRNRRLRAELKARRDLESRLNGMLAELERANRAKGEFLAQMSHELRTPLNAIIGFAELMLHQMVGPLAPRYVDYARDIHLSGQLLLEMIEEILDLSRIEAGATELAEEAVDLRMVLDTSLRLVEPRARSKMLAIRVDMPADLPRLRGDARMMRQIVLNLLSNAVKFTPAGGEVRVQAELLPDAGMVITVSDTGVGIPAGELGDVFQPFQRASNAVRQGIPGTGLGLPIARHMTELHAGRVEIESRLGAGTRVRVILPAARVIG